SSGLVSFFFRLRERRQRNREKIGFNILFHFGDLCQSFLFGFVEEEEVAVGRIPILCQFGIMTAPFRYIRSVPRKRLSSFSSQQGKNSSSLGGEIPDFFEILDGKREWSDFP